MAPYQNDYPYPRRRASDREEIPTLTQVVDAPMSVAAQAPLSTMSRAYAQQQNSENQSRQRLAEAAANRLASLPQRRLPQPINPTPGLLAEGQRQRRPGSDYPSLPEPRQSSFDPALETRGYVRPGSNPSISETQPSSLVAAYAQRRLANEQSYSASPPAHEDEAFMSPRIRQLMHSAAEHYQQTLNHEARGHYVGGNAAERVSTMLNQQPQPSAILPVIRHVNPADQLPPDEPPASMRYGSRTPMAVPMAAPSNVDAAQLNVIAAELAYRVGKRLTSDLPEIVERAFKTAIHGLENDIKNGINLMTQQAIREYLEERERSRK